MKKSQSTLVLLALETQFAPFGGLASVLTKIAVHLGLFATNIVNVFTPYHWRIAKTTQVKSTKVAEVLVPFADRNVSVQVLRFEDKHLVEGHSVTVRWHFLRSTEEAFFAGVKHPYDLGSSESEINRNLFRDSLFFGAAATRAVQELFPSGEVTLFMHDWSALTTVLTLIPSDRWNLRACLHNGYDMRALDQDLLPFGRKPARCPGDTILARSLALVKGPILTVSQQFALDLQQDPFQASIFTPHLQSIFGQKGTYGIDHGPFTALRFPHEFIGETLEGDYRRLAAWKALAKQEAVTALSNLVNSPATPVWGDISKFISDPEAPWFIMGGRLDNRQKGFDSCAKAITLLLEEGDPRCRWLLLPMEGIEGTAGLHFLRKLAERFPGHVLILPFMWKEGFAAVSAAAAFGLVCSYFEPGGLTSEFVANAAVPIVRGTGGSLQQVVPWKAAATMHQGIVAKCSRWHAASAPPSGIVYDVPRNDPSGWKFINAGGYGVHSGPDVVEQREKCPLFIDMAYELALAMSEALSLHENCPELYYEMAVNGVVHFARNFSWKKSGREYLRMIEADSPMVSCTTDSPVSIGVRS